MMNNQYLYGDTKRLFLNTNLGCHAKCSYCYLPDINMNIGAVPTNKISVENLLESLSSNIDFKKGKCGTILSIGCYSECWNDINKDDTIKLINILLEYQNPIQLATKEFINGNDFEKINLKNLAYYNHLSIFVSSSTVTQFQRYEKGTIDPKIRFDSFKLKSKYNVPMYLYIKPVLEYITIKDIDLYIRVIRQYNINAIVGELFTTKKGLLAPIAEGKLYYDNKNNDYSYIVNKFSLYCDVYKHSIEPIIRGIINE